jgi:CRISPR-associated RAMP protein (TIGR02581 family)
MFDTFKNRLELSGILWTVTALRISQGRSLEPIGSDLPVVKDALGHPLIPGSSFKGAMRSRLESFLRGIDDNLAANPAIEEEWAIPSDVMKQLKENHQNDADLTRTISSRTDLTSLLFGSPWMASKFQVRDLTVVRDSWFGQYQERDGVSIDRDTETAADGKLYDFQVVPAGTPFQFKAIVENAEEWELGLLMIGLHQFETEQIPLGGGRSRGLGVVKLEIKEMRWIDVRRSDEPDRCDPAKMQDYLRNLIMEQETPVGEVVSPEQRKEWASQFISSLQEHIDRLSQAKTTIEAAQSSSNQAK